MNYIAENLTNQEPLISIVIPVYNTESFLYKCLDSIIGQTYKNLEIIVVNDSSPGNVRSITESYMLNEPRIRYVEHKQNEGLFKARLTGSEIANGSFISFVDSDDYVSIDYFRLLIEKALEKNSDITEGRIIRETETGRRFIQNNNNILDDEITGLDIIDKFFTQEGLFYHWHVIWNKLYTKELWDKCMSHFKKQTKHLIMTEDLVFSSILFSNARKYSSVCYDGYFYYIRAEAATGAQTDLKKMLKCFTDMGTAFDFVEDYLLQEGFEIKYIYNLKNWKERYYRLWQNRIKNLPLRSFDKKTAKDALEKSLRLSGTNEFDQEDTFHSIIETDWDQRYEILKQTIASESIKYVSFDIFDTLIKRPFFEPSDLFLILDEYFHEVIPDSSFTNFSKIRSNAEIRARELTKLNKPSWEDVNLDEIYEQIGRDYGIPIEVLQKVKNKEEELEIKFSYKRDSAFELYKMAKMLKKKIIFVSDMYLSEKTIRCILSNNGYAGEERVFVSSEIRLLKHTGGMYKYISEELGLEGSSIIHIGDNWNSDVLKGKEHGWNTFYFPKATQLLTNSYNEKETGNSIEFFEEISRNSLKSDDFNKNFGVRCMLGTVANKIFDNPYTTFNPNSDFNIDPYFIGYYALGMHVFGLSKWLIEDAISNNYENIHFLARDGYLPHKAFKIIAELYPKAPGYKYIYASRKSMMPYLFSKKDYCGISEFVSLPNHNPKTFIKQFETITKDSFDYTDLTKEGVILTKNFSSQYEFKKFLDLFVSKAIDEEKLESYKKLLIKYFENNIGAHDAIFDLGYSGRLQTIIVNSIGRQSDGYYVHTQQDTPWIYARRNNFKLRVFYTSKPIVSGILREQFFAEQGPSCIAYKEDAYGTVIPVFEEYFPSGINGIIMKKMQAASLDFVKDMHFFFGEYMELLKLQNTDSSIPFEMYLHNSRQSDRSLLMHSYSDDEVYGGSDRVNLLNWWNQRTTFNLKNERYIEPSKIYSSETLLINHSKISKLIYFTLFDRNTLKIKLEARYKNKPLKHKLVFGVYSAFRRIKRSFSR